jgi:hypothetical protein
MSFFMIVALYLVMSLVFGLGLGKVLSGLEKTDAKYYRN